MTEKPEILFARLDMKEVLEKAEQLFAARKAEAEQENIGKDGKEEEVPVAPLEKRENFGHGIRHPQILHFLQNLIIGCRRQGFQVCVHTIRYSFVANYAAEIFIAHGDSPVYQIA